MRLNPIAPGQLGGSHGAAVRGWVVCLVLVAAMLSAAAFAERIERSASEVVSTVCAGCHATGQNGAPRIGDEKAWAARAAQGLTALTAHALQGIRNMPPHGGNPALSDIEIERAITQMVNLSGGHWVEPLRGAVPGAVRGSARIVQEHCSRCHQDGLAGAPKIGDRAAWMPRMKDGLEALVASAAHGHGGMPPRGGVADLSDSEIRGAVLYMFNFAVVMPQAGSSTTARAADPYHKVVGGADVYLGILPAQAVGERQVRAAAPSGKDQYHLNVSLFDANTGSAITDAQVKVQVADPIWSETRTLVAISVNNSISYGAYFRLRGPNLYTITVQIRRPGVAGVAEAKFDYRPI